MTHLVFKKGYIGGRQDQTQLIGVCQSFAQFKALIEERESTNYFPENQMVKDQGGRIVWEEGDQSFDFGDYSYTWSTIEQLSPSELDAVPVGAYNLHELETAEKREILAQVLVNSNEIVHYFGDMATEDTISQIVELFTKWVDMGHITDILGEYQREWNAAPCSEEGPADEQDKDLDEIVLNCAREIAAVAYP